MNAARSRRAVAAGASVLALSACGAIMPGNEFVEQGPRKVAEQGFAAMSDVTSMRILGSQEDKKLGFMRIDVQLDDTSCVGRLDTRGGSIRIIKNSDGAWFSADEDFWRTHAGSSPQVGSLIREYAGRWAAIGKKEKSMLELCDFGAYQDGFTLDKDDTDDTLEAGEVVPVGDADAVPVTGSDGKEMVTVWIAVDSPHRVLKIAPARDTGRPDALYFEEYGLDVVVESPAKKDVVDLPQAESPV